MIEREVTIGDARLILGDSYKVLPTLGWIEQLCMDPPYAFETAGGGQFRNARGHTDRIAEQGMDKGFDHRIINPLCCGSVIVFCHNDQIPALTTYLAGNFERFALCMWSKLNPMPVANKHYQPDSEFYIHAWSRGYHPAGELADKRRIVTSQVGRARDFNHPTVKPEAVMDKIMRNIGASSVCDPFMGTGSTGVAALKAGKSFIGIEKDPAHFETACRRIAAAAALKVAA
tara:strand:- start:907 stop:1596 length:690 start_codon:yes stop_codon:yes gene_type:complete